MDDLSYMHVPESEPRRYSTLVQRFKEAADKYPDIEYLIHRQGNGDRTSITYGHFYERSLNVGKYLVGIGVKPGENIIIIGPNSINWTVAAVGILSAGAVTVNATVGTQAGDDLCDIITSADCKGIVFGDTKNSDFIESIVGNFISDGLIKFAIGLSKTNKINAKTIDHIMEEVDFENNVLPHVSPEDPAVIFSTSGSTRKPKLVLHTHFNVVGFNIDVIVMSKDYEDHVVMFNDRPFAWLGGSPLWGSRNVAFSRVFIDATPTGDSSCCEEVWKIMEEEKCNHAVLLPAFLMDTLCVSMTPYKLNHIFTGGQIVDPKFAGLIGSWTDNIIIVYASSEFLIATLLQLTSSKDSEVMQYGDIGKPTKGIEVRVVDQNDKAVRLNTTGPIQIRTPYLLQKYLADDELTESSFAVGQWFRTGDVGKMLKGGNIIISGRDKDIISRGTRKILPGHIEDVVSKLEGVKQAAVVPVPDERLGEEICVCYIATTPVETTALYVEAHCRTYFLSGENTADGIGEMPKYFLEFDSFPLLATGKIDKNQLKLISKAKLNIL